MKDIIKYRQSLIPLWIKVIGWVFMVLSVLILLLLVVHPFLDLSGPMSIQIFGLHHVGSPYTLKAGFIISLFLFLGISFYGLLFGKDWGLYAAMANGYLGLIISITTLLVGGFSILRVEPLVQVPYLIHLHKIRQQWFCSQSSPDLSQLT